MAQDLGFYLGLIGSWHSDKPKFMNTVAALIQPLVDAQVMLGQLTAEFDLDTAIGVQLDVVGQWIGRTRFVEVPIEGVFFGFDDDGDGSRVGFDQGIWLGRYEPTDAITAMDDGHYRTLLKMQALANQWDGTINSIHDAFNAVFPGVIVQDLGDSQGTVMSMDVLIPGPQMSSLLLAVLEQDFPIKPAGVHVNMIESTVAYEPIFGFDIDGPAIGGFDHGAWGKIVYSA